MAVRLEGWSRRDFQSSYQAMPQELSEILGKETQCLGVGRKLNFILERASFNIGYWLITTDTFHR